MDHIPDPVIDYFSDEVILGIIVLTQHEKGGPFTYNVSIMARSCIVPIDLPVTSQIPVLTFRGGPVGLQLALQNILEPVGLAAYTLPIMKVVRNLRLRWSRKNRVVA